jgi:glutamate racemase
MTRERPIGVFDSGIGGLSVVARLRERLPDADLGVVADRARAPYGPRGGDQVRDFSEQITEFLLDQGALMVVIACNTASTAALHHLRRRHPDVPFVGMEPAVKPAVAATSNGTVGVLATATTSNGRLLSSVVDRFAGSTRVQVSVCDGWVELVESGMVEGEKAERLVRRYVEPLLAAGVDTLVFACTHYPFLSRIIGDVTGPGVTLIDPAPAVAEQAARVAREVGVDAGSGDLLLWASGDLDGLGELVARLAGLEVVPKAVTFPRCTVT